MRNIFDTIAEHFTDNTHDNFHDCDVNKRLDKINKRFDKINDYLKEIGLNDEQIKNVCQLIDSIDSYAYDKGESDGYNTAIRDELNGRDLL